MGSLQQRYQDIKNRYDRLSTFDLDGMKSQIAAYVGNPNATNQNSVVTTTAALTQYSQNLTGISQDLRQLLKDSGNSIHAERAGGGSEAEERYIERMYPSSVSEPREVTGSFLQRLRPTTIPAVMAASTFMAALAIFMIFQLLGIRGSVSFSPAVQSSIAGLTASTPGALPFYKNPMILAGVVVVLFILAVSFGILYYQSWQAQQNK